MCWTDGLFHASEEATPGAHCCHLVTVSCQYTTVTPNIPRRWTNSRCATEVPQQWTKRPQNEKTGLLVDNRSHMTITWNGLKPCEGRDYSQLTDFCPPHRRCNSSHTSTRSGQFHLIYTRKVISDFTLFSRFPPYVFLLLISPSFHISKCLFTFLPLYEAAVVRDLTPMPVGWMGWMGLIVKHGQTFSSSSVQLVNIIHLINVDVWLRLNSF